MALARACAVEIDLNGVPMMVEELRAQFCDPGEPLTREAPCERTDHHL